MKRMCGFRKVCGVRKVLIMAAVLLPSSVAFGQTHLMGGITPQAALEYMKSTDNLVIIEVNQKQWKKKVPFTGAMWIPYDEIEARCGEIPKDRPVLLHCGQGVVSVPAYDTLKRVRPDIPELSYIAGPPPIDEYNKWKKSTASKR